MGLRRERMLGALAAAAIVALVTALAHSVGGGTLPSPLLLAAATVWTLWTSFLAGTHSFPRIVAAVLVSQPVMHFVFASGEHSVAGGAGHAHGAAVSLAATSVHHGPNMIGAHILAGIVSVAVLHSGARLLRAAWRAALRAVLRVPVAQLCALPVAARAATPPPVPVPHRRLCVLSSRVLRGPPLALAF